MVKVVCALCQLAYGLSNDSTDKYFRVSETSLLLSLKDFFRVVIAAFCDRYLRRPTVSELQRIEKKFAAVGFLEWLSVGDCASWIYEKFHKALQSINVGGKSHSTPDVRMEAICDLGMYIWHMCSWLPGSLKDINVIDLSPFFRNLLAGRYPLAQCEYPNQWADLQLAVPVNPWNLSKL